MIKKQKSVQDMVNSAQARQDYIAEAESREQNRMYRIQKKLLDSPLSINDLMGNMGSVPLTRADVMQGMEDIPVRHNMITEQYPIDIADNILMEEQFSPKKQKQETKYWGIKKYLGETRSGSKIPVWKIINTQNGVSLDKIFKLEEVAYKIATILNQTGNVNDSRVISIMNAYDKRDRLLKEIRMMEKDSQGKPMKTKLIESKRSELAQLDYKLGV